MSAAENIRALRKQAGWSQLDLSRFVTGWFQQTLTKVELGQRGLLFDEAIQIADALGVPLDALAGRSEANPRPNHDLALVQIALGLDSLAAFARGSRENADE